HDEIVRAENPLLEALQVGILGHDALELGTAETFREAGRQDDGASLLDDRQRAGQALDRLIPGGIERIAGAAGDHHVEPLGHRHLDDLSHDTHAFPPGPDHVAGADPGDAALAIETDIDDKIAAGHLGDARVLLVYRVALDDAAIGTRMLEEARAVPD